MNEKTTEPLLTIGECARLLRVSVRTVRRYSDAGHLPVVHFSRRIIRFRAEDVERFMNNGVTRDLEDDAQP